MSNLLCTLQGCNVTQYPEDNKRCEAIGDGDIDADGSPFAYNPQNTGLDDLRNAGRPGNWYGIVTDRHGVPIIQGPNDPAPGYYVSATAYRWSGKSPADPLCYIDSATVPFIVIENFIRRRAIGIVLGCRARVTNLRTNQFVEAVVGDIGPLYKFGEISIAAAKAIGIDSSPRTGGTSDKILKFEFWPDTPAIVNGVTYELIRA